MPLPLQHTIKQLDNETGFSILPTNYIMTHQIKGDELVLRNLVDIDKVYAALLWLKQHNDFYKDIDIPARPDLLFSTISTDQFPVPSHQRDLQSSHEADSDIQPEVHNLQSSDVCPLPTNVFSTDANLEVQVTQTSRLCPLPIQKENVCDNSENNESLKAKRTATDECTVINNHERNPENLNEKETDNESHPSKMIERLSSLKMQSMLEHYSVVDYDLQGKSIMDVEHFYQFLHIDSKPLSYKEKNIDASFSEYTPIWKGGKKQSQGGPITIQDV